MFSGIIHDMAALVSRDESEQGAKIRVSLPQSIDVASIVVGESIAHDGVCLTVVALQERELEYDLASETLRKTTLGEKPLGALLNIERSLSVGDRVHGHFVQGHVDTVASVRAIEQEGETICLSFSLPDVIRGLIAPKGSVTINGVSLTVGDVSRDSFSCYIIPHTAAITNLGRLRLAESVNVEADCIARYVAALLHAEQTR